MNGICCGMEQPAPAPPLSSSPWLGYSTIVQVSGDTHMLVVDTSAVLAVLLNEPSRAAIVRRTRGRRVLAAPSLPWEVGNALVALVRRRRAGSTEIAAAWASFLKIPLRYTPCDGGAAMRIAVEYGLYAYDAYVLEAARNARAPLLSLDARQTAVAAALGLDVMEIPG